MSIFHDLDSFRMGTTVFTGNIMCSWHLCYLFQNMLHEEIVRSGISLMKAKGFTGNIRNFVPMWSKYRLWLMNSMQSLNSV
jgi:hypothetical protein